MLSAIAGLFRRPARRPPGVPVPTGDDVAHYLRIREAARKLSNSLLRTIPTRAMDEIGAALGFLRGSTFVFDSEDMMDVFADCCLFDWIENGTNLVERHAAKAPPPADPAEREMLEAMTRARYTILRPRGRVPYKGVSATDMRTGEAVFVIDMNFSVSCCLDGRCLATRLLPMGQFWMTGGAALPVPPELAEMFLPGGAISSLLPEEGSAEPLDDHDAVLVLVRSALELGAAEEINYSSDLKTPGRVYDPGRGPVGIEVGSPRRPSGNARCKCGSGRLHKRCCGREERRTA